MTDDSIAERRDPQEIGLPKESRFPSDLPKEMDNPARRALVQAGTWRLEHCAGLSEGELKPLHGVGPRAIDQLGRALSAKGLPLAIETGSQHGGGQR